MQGWATTWAQPPGDGAELEQGGWAGWAVLRVRGRTPHKARIWRPNGCGQDNQCPTVRDGGPRGFYVEDVFACGYRALNHTACGVPFCCCSVLSHILDSL